MLAALAKRNFRLADQLVAESDIILKTEPDLANYTETWEQLKNQLKNQKKQADEKEKKVWEAAFKKRQSSSVSMYADEETEKKAQAPAFNPADLARINQPTGTQDMNEILTKFMQNSSEYSKNLTTDSKRITQNPGENQNNEEIVHSTSWYPIAALGLAAASIGAYFFLRNKN